MSWRWLIGYLYLGVDYQTSIHLRGGGCRVYSVGVQDVLPTSKWWLRHWLNYHLVHLCSLRDKYGSFSIALLWLTAPSFKALCPYQFGVVFHIVVMLKALSTLWSKQKFPKSHCLCELNELTSTTSFCMFSTYLWVCWPIEAKSKEHIGLERSYMIQRDFQAKLGLDINWAMVSGFAYAHRTELCIVYMPSHFQTPIFFLSG